MIPFTIFGIMILSVLTIMIVIMIMSSMIISCISILVVGYPFTRICSIPIPFTWIIYYLGMLVLSGSSGVRISSSRIVLLFDLKFVSFYF